jgi:hypothetical protein
MLAHVSPVCIGRSPMHIRRIRAGMTHFAFTMASYVATERCKSCLWTPRNARRSVRSAAPALSQVWPWTSCAGIREGLGQVLH